MCNVNTYIKHLIPSAYTMKVIIDTSEYRVLFNQLKAEFYSMEVTLVKPMDPLNIPYFHFTRVFKLLTFDFLCRFVTQTTPTLLQVLILVLL